MCSDACVRQHLIPSHQAHTPAQRAQRCGRGRPVGRAGCVLQQPPPDTRRCSRQRPHASPETSRGGGPALQTAIGASSTSGQKEKGVSMFVSPKGLSRRSPPQQMPPCVGGWLSVSLTQVSVHSVSCLEYVTHQTWIRQTAGSYTILSQRDNSAWCVCVCV